MRNVDVYIAAQFADIYATRRFYTTNRSNSHKICFT